MLSTLLETWEVVVARKDKPLVSMSKEEREEVWDDAFVKEEGMILDCALECSSRTVINS